MSSEPSSDPPNADMKVSVNPQRAADLAENLASILSRINTSANSSAVSVPRLVAVSKLKPASDILALHQPPIGSPQAHFGENYVQELVEKSRLLPRSIKWHFIGGLQSNKARDLARDVPNLWAVESVDSVKKAGLLDKGRGEMVKRWEDAKAEEKGEVEEGVVREKLRVFVQVNTSGEDSKSGVEPEGKELVDMCKYVREECDTLKLQGLMTIGAIARSQASTEETVNEDFVCLKKAREMVCKELGIEEGELELSMGMSEDFEAAVKQGSSEVRVGSTIFGARPPKKEAKVVEQAEEAKK